MATVMLVEVWKLNKEFMIVIKSYWQHETYQQPFMTHVKQYKCSETVSIVTVIKITKGLWMINLSYSGGKGDVVIWVWTSRLANLAYLNACTVRYCHCLCNSVYRYTVYEHAHRHMWAVETWATWLLNKQLRYNSTWQPPVFMLCYEHRSSYQHNSWRLEHTIFTTRISIRYTRSIIFKTIFPFYQNTWNSIAFKPSWRLSLN